MQEKKGKNVTNSYKLNQIFIIGFIIAVSGSVYTAYHLLTECQSLHVKIEEMKGNQVELEKNIAIGGVQGVVEKMVPSHELWRPIQEKISDTVVQVFSQVVEIDLCLPYKVAKQFTSCGTAFFIDEDGHLVTNAHVVDQAEAVWIQIPSLGQRIIDVDVVGVSPERDLALLRVRPDGLALIRTLLSAVPYLPLGDSDLVRRADEVLALGYPLGQSSLKSTTGIISGRQNHMIQMSAPINPGSSGGPSVNSNGAVIGINSSGIAEAQNIGYIIPINDLKNILNDLKTTQLVRKPFLGILYNNATESLTTFLGNPQPGGCYIVDAVKGSTLYKAGIQRGDMLYEIDGYKVDMYGDMSVPWNEDKISIMDYVSRLSVGQSVAILIYRNGVSKEFTVRFTRTELPAIRRIYPGYEDIDYEIVAGMVVMPLTLNHVQGMISMVPGLSRFAAIKNQSEPVLFVSHIFSSSHLCRSRTISVGSTIHEVNGMKVTTLDEFRSAIRSSIGSKYLTIKASDNRDIIGIQEGMFCVLPMDEILKEEAQLAAVYRYPVSDMTKELLQARLTHSTKETALTT